MDYDVHAYLDGGLSERLFDTSHSGGSDQSISGIYTPLYPPTTATGDY